MWVTSWHGLEASWHSLQVYETYRLDFPSMRTFPQPNCHSRSSNASRAEQFPAKALAKPGWCNPKRFLLPILQTRAEQQKL
jgi:hypothetical protein